MQFAQFNDNRAIEGFGWIFSFLVAGLLLVVALSKPRSIDVLKAQIPKVSPPSKEELEKIHAGLRENAEVLAVEVEQRATALADSLIIERDAMTPGIVHTVQGSRELGDKLVETLDMHIHERCLFLMLGLIGMRRSKGNKMYITGIEFKTLQEQVSKKIIQMAVATQRNMPIPVAIDPPALSRSIMNDIQEIRKAITSYCIAVESGTSEPEGALLDWFKRNAGIKLRGNPHVNHALQETSDKSVDPVLPVETHRCGDLLAEWLEKSSSPDVIKQLIKETGYDDSSEKKKIRIVGELVIANTALAIFAVNQVFEPTEAKPIIDSLLAVANKSIFRFLEERDSTFKKRYEQRLSEYFKILSEDKPALGMSFCFMSNLDLDPLKNLQTQLLVTARLGGSLTHTVDILKGLRITTGGIASPPSISATPPPRQEKERDQHRYGIHIFELDIAIRAHDDYAERFSIYQPLNGNGKTLQWNSCLSVYTSMRYAARKTAMKINGVVWNTIRQALITRMISAEGAEIGTLQYDRLQQEADQQLDVIDKRVEECLQKNDLRPVLSFLVLMFGTANEEPAVQALSAIVLLNTEDAHTKILPELLEGLQ